MTLKKLQKNRITYLLIALVIIVIWSGSGEKKEASWETCTSHNTNAAFCILLPQYILNLYKVTDFPYGCVAFENREKCVASKCFIAEQVKTGTNIDVCLPTVPNEWVAESAEGCENCFSDYGKDKYLCRECEPDEPEPGRCNANEMGIAKIIYPKYIDDCKTAYYLIVFGGGLIVLMLILAAL